MKKTIIIITIIITVGVGALFWLYYSQPETSKQEAKTEEVIDPVIEPETETGFAKSVFFIHHSTGEIYWDNGMKQALVDADYSAAAPWWGGNTDPKDFYSEFTNDANWEIIGDKKIIIFKSCYPASDISSNAMLEDYKKWYNQLYAIYEKYPNRLFVPLSTPPLLQASTTSTAAQLALDFETWLIGEYKEEYSGTNLAPFALHSLLSDSSGYLASAYISSQDNDHPNAASGNVVGEAIIEHLTEYVE